MSVKSKKDWIFTISQHKNVLNRNVPNRTLKKGKNMKNELVEKIIVSFQKRLGLSKKEKNIAPEERKAMVIRDGKTVTIIPKSNAEYIPN